MIIDFLSGTIVAKFKKNIEFKSKIGINGIIKKICVLVLLVFFIPLSSVLETEIRNGFIYTIYIGYLCMELESIIENYKKLNIDTTLFEKFIAKIKRKKND